MSIFLNRDKFLRLASAFVLLLTLPFLVGASEPPPEVVTPNPPSPPDLAYMPGQLLVKLKPAALPAGEAATASFSALDQLMARSEVVSAQPVFSEPFSDDQLATDLGLDRVYLLELAAGQDVFAAMRALADDPAVEVAEPNYILTIAEIPNDTAFGLQWGLHNTGQLISDSAGRNDADIDLPEAWDITKGSQEIIIAVVDTGVDLTHPDLESKLVPGYNTVDNTTNTQDTNGHGTHVAGIAAAATNNSTGVAGVCWNCKIMPIKAFSGEEGTIDDVVNGISYAVNHGAHVINLSLGGAGSSDTLHTVIRFAYASNIPVVAAMMNAGSGEDYIPAVYPETIAVGATDKQDLRAEYSNYGNHIDLTAPGSDILSTFFLNQYSYISGTSMSTPHVAGVLGLMRSIAPKKTVEELRAILRSSADDLGEPGWDIYYGAGRLNAYRALLATKTITSVSLRGPYLVRLRAPTTFTSQASPASVPLPLTFSWTATGQATHSFTTNSATNQVTFTWTTPGPKIVRVTASNLSSTRSATITVTVGRLFFLPELMKK